MTISTVNIERHRGDGRPKIVPPGETKGVWYTRASTLAKALEDTYNLEAWSNRMVAVGIATNDHLHARAAALAGHDLEASTVKKDLDEVCADAKQAAGSQTGRDYGSALHDVLHLVMGMGNVEVPERFTLDVNAVLATIDAHGYDVDPECVERFVVVDELQVAGSADVVLVRRSDGRRFVADYKTGKLYDGTSFPIQFAVYARGELYDPDQDPARLSTLDVDLDTGILIHIRPMSGVCELHEVDIAAGWEMAKLAVEVRDARKGRYLTKIAPPDLTHSLAASLVDVGVQPAQEQDDAAPGPATKIAPPAEGTTATAPAAGGAAVEDPETTQRRAHLVRRYQQLRDQGIDAQVIAAVWPTGVPGPKRSSEWGLTDFGLIGTALNRVEAAHADGFTEPDPRPVVEREAPVVERAATTIDEGPDMELDDCDAVRAKVDSLPDDQRHAVAAIVAACAAAGHSISMKQRPSARRFTIARALYFMGLNGDLAQPDEERLRALCAYVTGDDACLVPGVSIGEVVGTLDLLSADRLAALVRQGVAYRIDDVGDIRVAVAA